MATLSLSFQPLARWSSKLVLVGRKTALLSEGALALLPTQFAADLWRHLVESADPGDDGKEASSLYMSATGKAATIVACVLPDVCSRHASHQNHLAAATTSDFAFPVLK